MSDCELGPALTKLFRLLAKEHKTICVVGHDVHALLAHLQKQWIPPHQAIIFDTQELWQHQYNEVYQVSLDMAMKTTLGVHCETETDDAGNISYLIPSLLCVLVEGRRFP